MKYIILCNDKGDTLCGADGYRTVDGRYGQGAILEVATKFRNTYKKNFPHKYKFWTHAMITTSINGTAKPHKLEEE